MVPNANSKGKRGGEESFGRNRPRGFNQGSSNKPVPLLKFDVGNDWLVFEEKMLTACFEKFDDLGRLI